MAQINIKSKLLYIVSYVIMTLILDNCVGILVENSLAPSFGTYEYGSTPIIFFAILRE